MELPVYTGSSQSIDAFDVQSADSGTIHCGEPGCNFKFHRIKQLRQHLVARHERKVQCRSIYMQNWNEFETWKDEFEKKENFDFYQMNSRALPEVRYYYCSMGKNRGSANGRRATTNRCTASLVAKVNTTTGAMFVDLVDYHHGHPNPKDVPRVPSLLSKEDKSLLQQMVQEDVTKNHFLHHVKSKRYPKVKAETLYREFNRRTFYRTYRCLETKYTDECPLDRLLQLVTDDEKAGVILYKAKHAPFTDSPSCMLITTKYGLPPVGDEVSMFAVISRFQIRLIMEFGKTIILERVVQDIAHTADKSTRCVLYMRTLDDQGKDIPVGFFMVNSPSVELAIYFFCAIKDGCGEVSPKLIISNDMGELGNVWCQVFKKKETTCMISPWHLERQFIDLAPCFDHSDTFEFFKEQFMRILRIPDPNSFQSELGIFMREFNRFPQVKEAFNHMSRNLMENISKWAFSYNPTLLTELNQCLNCYNNRNLHTIRQFPLRKFGRCLYLILQHHRKKLRKCQKIKVAPGKKPNPHARISLLYQPLGLSSNSQEEVHSEESGNNLDTDSIHEIERNNRMDNKGRKRCRSNSPIKGHVTLTKRKKNCKAAIPEVELEQADDYSNRERGIASLQLQSDYAIAEVAKQERANGIKLTLEQLDNFKCYFGESMVKALANKVVENCDLYPVKGASGSLNRPRNLAKTTKVEFESADLCKPAEEAEQTTQTSMTCRIDPRARGESFKIYGCNNNNNIKKTKVISAKKNEIKIKRCESGPIVLSSVKTNVPSNAQRSSQKTVPVLSQPAHCSCSDVSYSEHIIKIEPDESGMLTESFTIKEESIHIEGLPISNIQPKSLKRMSSKSGKLKNYGTVNMAVPSVEPSITICTAEDVYPSNVELIIDDNAREKEFLARDFDNNNWTVGSVSNESCSLPRVFIKQELIEETLDDDMKVCKIEDNAGDQMESEMILRNCSPNSHDYTSDESVSFEVDQNHVLLYYQNSDVNSAIDPSSQVQDSQTLLISPNPVPDDQLNPYPNLQMDDGTGFAAVEPLVPSADFLQSQESMEVQNIIEISGDSGNLRDILLMGWPGDGGGGGGILGGHSATDFINGANIADDSTNLLNNDGINIVGNNLINLVDDSSNLVVDNNIINATNFIDNNLVVNNTVINGSDLVFDNNIINVGNFIVDNNLVNVANVGNIVDVGSSVNGSVGMTGAVVVPDYELPVAIELTVGSSDLTQLFSTMPDPPHLQL